MPRGPTRSACDRCHSQKLRCPKAPGSSICTRCSRLGVTCVFSPRGRASAPQNDSLEFESASPGVPGSQDPPNETHFLDWPFTNDNLSLGDLLKMPTPAASDEMHLDPTGQVAEQSDAPRPSSEEGNLPPTCSQQLTKLMADADVVLLTMPPESAFHVDIGNFESQNEQIKKRYLHDDFMGQIFDVMQRLVDIYPEAVTAALHPGGGPRAPCQVPNCIHATCLADDSASPPHPVGFSMALKMLVSPARPRMDTPITNLVISCHMRVLDFIDRTLVCGLTCFSVTHSFPTLVDPRFILPNLQIGSFVTTSGSSVMLQMTLLRHLLFLLTGRLQNFMDTLASMECTREIGSLIMQFELLKDRQDNTVENVATLGAWVMQRGDVK